MPSPLSYSRPIDDVLRAVGIDPSTFRGSILDDAFRKELHERGARGVFRTEFEEELKEGETTTPYSSNVEAIRYNPRDGTLFVQFNNRREKSGSRLYQYYMTDIDEFSADDLFQELQSSPSPGSVVWERLRRPGMRFIKI